MNQCTSNRSCTTRNIWPFFFCVSLPLRMVTKDHLHCLLGLWTKKQIWMMELVCYRNNVKNSYVQQVKISYTGNTSSSSQPSYIDLEALGFLLSMCGSSVQGTAIYSHWDDDLRFLQSTLKDRDQILLKADRLWRARHHTARWNHFSEEQKSRPGILTQTLLHRYLEKP